MSVRESRVPPKLECVYRTLWSTLFLRKVWRELFSRQQGESFREEFLYVTGVPAGTGLNRVFVPLCLLPVVYSSASAVGVRVDGMSNTRQLALLDKHGHRVLAYVHSHPGTGERSVDPSSTDLDMAERFEGAGYTVVGLIFSRDGFIRAFTWAQEFCIEVHGKGIEQHGDNLFRIQPVHQRCRSLREAR